MIFQNIDNSYGYNFLIGNGENPRSYRFTYGFPLADHYDFGDGYLYCFGDGFFGANGIKPYYFHNLILREMR